MKSVRNHASSEERLPVRIEIQSPRIAGAFSKGLELPTFRLVAPHCGVQLYFTHLGLREYAVQSVELAVGSPLKRIERLVGVLASESGQEDVTVVASASAFPILKKEQMRRGT